MVSEPMQYRRQHRGFTPEAIENMRYRYVETDEPQESIAADFGIHRKTLDRLAKDQGWVLRKDRAPRDLPPDLKLEVETEKAVRAVAPTTDSAKRLSMAERLERAVETQLAALERTQAMLGAEPPAVGEGERAARTIERLTAALYKIRHLRSPQVAPDQLAAADMPKDIDEFRHALARRIEAFVRSRTDASLSERREPADRSEP